MMKTIHAPQRRKARASLAARGAICALGLIFAGAAAAQPDLLRIMGLLDADGDRELSQAEVMAAPERLATLDLDADGALSLEEMGGPSPIVRGQIRGQAIIRVLDENGDLQISAEELAHASQSLIRLDHDGDWHLSEADLAFPGQPGAPPPGGRMSPAALQEMFAYHDEMTGAMLPGADDRALAGYTLIHEAPSSNDVYYANAIYLLDEQGEKVHSWPPGDYEQPEGTVAYLLENGLLLRTMARHDWIHSAGYPVGANGIVQLVDWDGAAVWEFELDQPGKHVLHHDVAYMPNGNILALAYHAFTREEARSMGWDGEFPNRDTIWMEKVLELQPDLETGATEIVWQWNSWDHLVQDKFPDRANYGDPGTERGKLDVNYLRPGMVPFNAGQLFHLNSIDYSPALDQIILSSATYAELWVLDHGTTMAEAASDQGGRHGRGGDLLYRWGNPYPTRSGSLDDAALWWQHSIQWVPEGLKGAGNALIFNNGTFRGRDRQHIPGGPPDMGFGLAWSELLEVALPQLEDGGYDPEAEPEITWSWNRDGAMDFYSPFMSGLQRLPNGNVIAVGAHNKRIIEVTDEGELALDYRPAGTGRMYRVYKFPADYPAFDGKF